MAWLQRYWDRSRIQATTAGELMTAPAHTIGPEATVVDAAKLLDHHGIKRLPVVNDDGNLVGIVSRRDLLTVVSKQRRGHRRRDHPRALNDMALKVDVQPKMINVCSTQVLARRRSGHDRQPMHLTRH